MISDNEAMVLPIWKAPMQPARKAIQTLGQWVLLIA